MGKDSPDWGVANAIGSYGDILSQNGRMRMYISNATIAAGNQSALGRTHINESTILKICGIRVLCEDDIRFKFWLYNTYWSWGYFYVQDSYEWMFQPGLNWYLAKGDFISMNIFNITADSHVFRTQVIGMEYPKPPGWVVKPDAYFTVDDSTPVVGQEIQFTEDSEYSPTSWFWDFRDGNTSNEQHPKHTYTVAGTYYPILFSENAGGQDYYSSAVVVSAP